MPGMLSNLGSSAKGMFTDGAAEKAILYIYLVDLSGSNDTTFEDVKSMLEPEVTALNNLQKSLLSDAKSKLKIDMDSIKDNLKSVVEPTHDPENIGAIDANHTDFVKFQVQYNPATIRLYSVNGKIQSRRGEEGIDKLSVYNFTGKSKLSFDLVFDDCDNMNAFGLNEVVNANLSTGINKGYNTLKHGGNNYSVRKRMDAIMSLLSSAATQQIVFYWANMCFRGTLTDVGNKFTMFNPQGNPIRGEMHLELTQDKQHDELGYKDDYWDNAFKSVFKPKSGLSGSAGGQSLASKITDNNLFSLRL